MGSTLFYITQL